MKYILVLFLFCVLRGFSQNTDETVLEIPSGVKTLGQKFKVEYHGTFSQFGYISLKDSITGVPKVFKNTGQLDTYSESFIPFDGNFHTSFYSEMNVPPMLDSLADGTYALRYTSFPYGDGDTVKFKTDAVYALIPIKNFQVTGTVSWYYPNGKIAQKSEYLNGEKQGETHYFQRNYKNDQLTLLEKKQYQSNMEDGRYYAEYHRNIAENQKILGRKVFICTGNKKKGVNDGDFLITVDNKTFVSGKFKNGQPVDHWIINQWTTKGKKLIVLPNMEFEVNDDSVLVHADFIPRNLFSYELLNDNEFQFRSRDLWKAPSNFANNWLEYSEITSLIEEWNTGQFYPGKNNFGSIYSVKSIQNCSGLMDKNVNNQVWNSRLSYAPSLVDSTGKHFKIEDLISLCGIYYDFKQFKSYHPNGKLHFSFDFTDSTNSIQSPVFLENGKKLNEVVFSKKDGLYHYKEYDLNRKIITENKYDKNGKFVSYGDFSEIKLVDGDTLRSYRKSDWSFYRDIRDSKENRSICKHLIIDYATNRLINSHHYNPVTKRGTIYKLELATGTSTTLEYECDSLNQIGTFRETYAFKDLSFTITGTGDWRNANFIYDIDNGFIANYEVGELMQNKQPFNGNFHVSISEKKQPTKSHFSKGTYSIVLNPKNNTLFNSFFTKLNRHLSTNERLNQETHNWVPDSIQQKINLKDLYFTVKNGRPADSIVKKTAVAYYLMKYYFANDSLIEFNNKNEWLSRNGTVYYGSSEDDFGSNWISKITCNNDSRKTHSTLDLNSKGDTLYYFYQNNLNGISVNFSLKYGKKLRSISLNDTILHYTYHHNSYGDSFAYNRNMQTCKKYDKNQVLQTAFLMKEDLLFQINNYDKNGLLKEEQFITRGYLTHSNKYTNGFRVSDILYLTVDSVIPNLEDLPEELDPQIVRYVIPENNHGFSPRYSFKNVVRGRFTRYQNEKPVEKGLLVSNRKSGIWSYTYPDLPDYQMDFHDTSFHYETTLKYTNLTYTGTYTQKNKQGNPWKSGTFSEFDSEYNCMDDNYTEQYIIQYDLWNGESTDRKSIQVVNYYPNGAKMNEGTIVNGKPEGLWLWYHNDGLLYQAGKYHNGLREGRWMKGDLSKVRFTGETCLDPESKDYRNIIENIVVDIIYYEKGLVAKSESHELNIGK